MEDLKKIYSYCFENKNLLDKVEKCGCFYCNTIFKTSEIVSWVNDKKDKTAQCPYCDIDSVIPESLNGEYELTELLLKKLNKIYF